jgi:GTP-binding protein EngB required for normal cell division
MNRSDLVKNLQEIEAFLKGDAGFLLPPDELEAFTHRTAELRENAEKQVEVLYAAIVGGTGVGKSTLINALACQEISRSSDRRPYTDRAVVYRHRDSERGLHNIAHLIREPDALHESDETRYLILLDLPDFDSKEENNRTTVRHILPDMDCVIWVTSPEKYADAALYELVRQTAKDQENFVFVLNKADQLLLQGQPDPLAKLKEVTGDLLFRLKHESGILQPRMFSLSAEEELRGHPDNEGFLAREFQRFREFLMVRRDAKEIASVKTMNLVEETRRLLKDLTGQVKPFRRSVIAKSDEFAAPHGPEKIPVKRMGEEERLLTEQLYRSLAREEASVAPVAFGLRFLSRSRSESSPQGLESSFKEMAEVTARDKIVELHKVAARMDAEILLALKGTEAAKRLREPGITLDEAVNQAFASFSEQVAQEKRGLAGTRSAVRRFFQRCVLAVPVIILALKLAGWDRVEAWLSSPSLGGALKLVLSLLTSLFGSDGLAGLTTLLICEILLILYLAARRNTRIRKTAERLVLAGKGYLETATDSAARSVQAERTEAIRRVDQGMEGLTKLAARFDIADVSPGTG